MSASEIAVEQMLVSVRPDIGNASEVEFIRSIRSIRSMSSDDYIERLNNWRVEHRISAARSRAAARAAVRNAFQVDGLPRPAGLAVAARQMFDVGSCAEDESNAAPADRLIWWLATVGDGEIDENECAVEVAARIAPSLLRFYSEVPGANRAALAAAAAAERAAGGWAPPDEFIEAVCDSWPDARASLFYGDSAADAARLAFDVHLPGTSIDLIAAAVAHPLVAPEIALAAMYTAAGLGKVQSWAARELAVAIVAKFRAQSR